jgi:tRNA (guanine-N7-)-methyltransferase
MPQSPHGALRTFGRIKSRPIKPRQEALLETLLPRIAAPREAFDPAGLMPGARAVVLEIGFGGGEHLAAQAAKAPDTLFIGAEPFLNGVASGLRHIDEQGLSNVRLHMGDARELMDLMPAASLDQVYILFPDPWPKTRHHKRRLIQVDFLQALAKLVKPGGRVRFATDWADYANWTLERFEASPAFRWQAERADDWRTPPPDHVTTRYETKKLGDCAPVFLDFVRV